MVKNHVLRVIHTSTVTAPSTSNLVSITSKAVQSTEKVIRVIDGDWQVPDILNT